MQIQYRNYNQVNKVFIIPNMIYYCTMYICTYLEKERQSQVGGTRPSSIHQAFRPKSINRDRQKCSSHVNGAHQGEIISEGVRSLNIATILSKSLIWLKYKCPIPILSRKIEYPAHYSKQLIQFFCSAERFGTVLGQWDQN